MAFDSNDAEKSRKILAGFHEVEQLVSAYQAQNGHLPKVDDLQDWTNNGAFGKPLLTIRPAPVRYCDDKDDPFESDPKDQFVLYLWRGEFGDCYSSPSGRTTLQTTEAFWLKRNLLTSSPFVVGTLLFGAVLSYVAFRLWFPRRKQIEGQAASSS